MRQETANGNQGLPQEIFDKVISYYLESFLINNIIIKYYSQTTVK